MPVIPAPSPSRGVSTRGILRTAIPVGVVALIAALAFGPRPPAVATERRGVVDLATRIADTAQPGHHRLGAFILRDGETRFAGLGADEHTEFEIGSVAKTFTAEIFRNQIQAGRVTPDTTVGEIIAAGTAPIAEVTLLELAEHTSGLPRLGGLSRWTSLVATFTAGNPYAAVSRGDVIKAALTADLRNRSERRYSNLGFALLGQLLAIEAGTTYEDLLRTQVLVPLGMTATYAMTTGAVSGNAPRGLTFSGRTVTPWEMGAYNPAGGIRSTPQDMARYAEHLLTTGLPEFTWVTEESGLSWHNGATYGFSSMLIIDQHANQAAFIAGDTPAGVEEMTAHLLDLVGAGRSPVS